MAEYSSCLAKYCFWVLQLLKQLLSDTITATIELTCRFLIQTFNKHQFVRKKFIYIKCRANALKAKTITKMLQFMHKTTFYAYKPTVRCLTSMSHEYSKLLMHSEFEYHVAYQFSGLSTVAYKRVAYKKKWVYRFSLFFLEKLIKCGCRVC